MKKAHFFIGLLFIFGSLSVSIHAQQTLNLVTVDNFKPYRWSENNRLIGMNMDTLDEIGRRANITFNVSIVPWARLIKLTEKGLVHGAFAANKTLEREKFAHFIDVPLHQHFFNIFVFKDEEFKFDHISDLYGKKIGKIRGFSISDEFNQAQKDKKIDVLDLNSAKQYFGMLELGRINGFVGSYYPTLYELQEKGLASKIVALPKPVSKLKNAYIMISKAAKFDNKETIIFNINQALKEMVADGTISKINAKYTGK